MTGLSLSKLEPQILSSARAQNRGFVFTSSPSLEEEGGGGWGWPGRGRPIWKWIDQPVIELNFCQRRGYIGQKLPSALWSKMSPEWKTSQSPKITHFSHPTENIYGRTLMLWKMVVLTTLTITCHLQNLIQVDWFNLILKLQRYFFCSIHSFFSSCVAKHFFIGKAVFLHLN